ncbi:hypothetical protein [Coriobacterium glomerans]|uniref:hypothetical protein n=1 Tax=Coriobacterium glomerans TaxID=33871 RepID=UPI0012EA2E6B|nr:hypothetical protein [Coriobacterium glomerans]
MNSEIELAEYDGVSVAIVPIIRQVNKLGKVSKRLKTAQSVHAAVIPGILGYRRYQLCQETGDKWLLDDGCGDVIGREKLRDRFNRKIRDSGVVRHPVRNLRNSWQTFTKWTLEIEPSKIERMMGHVGKTITERYYDRPEAEMLAKTIAAAYKMHPYAESWTDEVVST